MIVLFSTAVWNSENTDRVSTFGRFLFYIPVKCGLWHYFPMDGITCKPKPSCSFTVIFLFDLQSWTLIPQWSEAFQVYQFIFALVKLAWIWNLFSVSLAYAAGKSLAKCMQDCGGKRIGQGFKSSTYDLEVSTSFRWWWLMEIAFPLENYIKQLYVLRLNLLNKAFIYRLCPSY